MADYQKSYDSELAGKNRELSTWTDEDEKFLIAAETRLKFFTDRLNKFIEQDSAKFWIETRDIGLNFQEFGSEKLAGHRQNEKNKQKNS